MTKRKVIRGKTHRTTAAEQRQFQLADAFARWISTKAYKAQVASRARAKSRKR